jgi:hypothetical protein
MVVVIISMLVIQLPSEEIPPEVRSAVLLQPEEPVSSEVPERFNKRMNEELEVKFLILIVGFQRESKAGFIQQPHMFLILFSSMTY